MRYALCFAYLLLSACAATQAQVNNESEAIASKYRADLATSTIMQPLWKKTGMLPAETTFDMLVIKEQPSDQERAAIREWATRVAQYNNDLLSIYRRNRVDGRAIALWEQSAAGSDTLRAQLHNGELTWGQYNQKRKDLSAAFARATAEVNAAIDQDNAQAAYQSSIVVQQMTANILQTQANIINSGPRVCNRIGNSVYCN